MDAEAEITYYNNSIEWKEVSACKVKLDSSGLFKMYFPWNKSNPAHLTISEQYTNMFLVSGDSIFVSADYNDFDRSIHYSGKGSEDNNYLAAEMLAGYETKANRYSAFNDANQFKLYIDSIEKLNNEFLKSNDSVGFTNDFRKYIFSTTKYRYINPRWMYKVGYNPREKKFFDKPVPENYFDFLKSLDLDDQQSFDNSTYTVALMRYLSEFNDSKVIVPDSVNDLQKAEMRIRQNYDYRKSIFKNKILDYQLTTYLKTNIGYVINDPVFSGMLIKDYRLTCKTQEYISIIDSIYSKAAKLAVGSPAQDFTLSNIDGKLISLSSLKGKVVFIDFWATWCAPCISAIPKTSLLENSFKDNCNVVFLNINIDDDMTRWKNFIAREQLHGENLFATKEQSVNLHSSYNFDGIPHYVLIDKQGKIIDANADNGERAKIKIENISNKP